MQMNMKPGHTWRNKIQFKEKYYSEGWHWKRFMGRELQETGELGDGGSPAAWVYQGSSSGAPARFFKGIW